MGTSDRPRTGTTDWKLVIGMMMGLLCLSLLVAWRMESSIDAMPVYVSIATNPPPQVAATLGKQTNWFVQVPYSSVTNKPVTEAEILEIKRAIPRLRTVGRLYRPYSIGIDSPTNAVAAFWRRRKPLFVHLEKVGEIWKIQSAGGAIVHFSNPPDLLDRISQSAP